LRPYLGGKLGDNSQLQILELEVFDRMRRFIYNRMMNILEAYSIFMWGSH
jgi:hypothetical protein